MAVLVTGIAGFVGSYLTELLLEKREKVVGLYWNSNLENIEHIKSKVQLYSCNVADFRQTHQIIKKIKPKEIYHLAAISSVGKSFSEPVFTFKVNFGGTQNILEAVRKENLKSKILIPNSADMYGRVSAQALPIKETHPLKPISPYAISKTCADVLAEQYFKIYGIPVIRTRSFNHTGPRQALGFVIPDFASQVAKIDLDLQKPVLKVGDLRAKRDISDVRDIVSGYYLLMKRGKPGETYNIGSGKIYSLKKVLQYLVSLSSRKIRVEIDKTRLRKIDIPVLQADITKIKKDTGWKAKTPLEKTLQDTYNFWSEYWLGNQN